jgi:hypothetical protein
MASRVFDAAAYDRDVARLSLEAMRGSADEDRKLQASTVAAGKTADGRALRANRPETIRRKGHSQPLRDRRGRLGKVGTYVLVKQFDGWRVEWPEWATHLADMGYEIGGVSREALDRSEQEIVRAMSGLRSSYAR